MWKNFNLYAFAVKILPPILRKDVLKAFLWALLKPLDDIIDAFNALVRDSDRRLSHNSFTVYLENFLNDLLNAHSRIYIADRIDDWSVYLSRREELMDYDVMTKKSEELPTIVLPSERPGKLRGLFVVYIPAALDSEENRRLITRWVNYYKYAGTTYTIETYE